MKNIFAIFMPPLVSDSCGEGEGIVFELFVRECVRDFVRASC